MAKGTVYSSVDPNAPGLRGYETISSGGFSNAFNSWYPRWGANSINAAITGVFSALSNIVGVFSANKVFDLYEDQEKLYIAQANEEARRIQLKGDVELRNLSIKHAVQQGTQEMTAAATGGNLSGSTLDMLTQNYKYDVMDERTSSINTLWEVDNAKRAGYIKAIQTAGQAMQLAYGNRARAIAGIGTGLSTAVGALLKDQQQYRHQDALFQIESDRTTKILERIDSHYGTTGAGLSGSITNFNYSTGGALESSSSNDVQTGITSFLMDENGIPFADPVTGINVHNDSGVSLPLIQLNTDGSVRTDYSPLKIN